MPPPVQEGDKAPIKGMYGRISSSRETILGTEVAVLVGSTVAAWFTLREQGIIIAEYEAEMIVELITAGCYGIAIISGAIAGGKFAKEKFFPAKKTEPAPPA